MPKAHTDQQTAHTAHQALVAKLLQPLLAKRRPERILVLKHDAAGDLQFETAAPAQVIRLSTREDAAGNPLRCHLEELPFAEASFELVILHHVLADGGEPFVAEVMRVLTAGGDLVVSGLNSSGLRSRFINRKPRMPALKLDKVCSMLKSNSVNVELCLLMGLGGFSRPAPKATWHGLGYPFADRVMLHGHRQSAIANKNVLRFKRVQPAGLASITLDGYSNREAAS
jgi:SAM-dependent methyltransferase